MKELKDLNYCVFDIECREDVDGKRNKFDQSQHLGVAVACTLTKDGEYMDWIGGAHPMFNLFHYLLGFDAIITYNGLGFDYPLLGGELKGEYNLTAPKFIENSLKGKTIDLCVDFKEALGVRVGLQKVISATTGDSKTMDGGLAPHNWRKGKCMEVISYCRNDVAMTKKLFDLAVAGEQLFVFDQVQQKKAFRCTPKLR